MNDKRGKIDNKDIVKALTVSMGFLSKAAEKLSISRNTLALWIKDDEELQQELKDIEESKLDFTESKLLKLIKDENPAAIFFHLKCKGKHRGYTERQELTGADGEKLETGVVILPEADK